MKQEKVIPEVISMTTMATVRPDTLPENANYHDAGCDVSKSCLNCSLIVCKYDDPGWVRRTGRLTRDIRVIESRRKNHLTVPELAAKFGLSSRTIHRIIKNDKAGGLKPNALIPRSPVFAMREQKFFKRPGTPPSMRCGRSS